jgi:hypothetical protein
VLGNKVLSDQLLIAQLLSDQHCSPPRESSDCCVQMQ